MSRAGDAFERARVLLDEGRPQGRVRLLLASDFDGTLSRPVLDPWSARIIPGARRALRRLAAMPHAHVALISGRSVADLAARARVGGISYRGDHGAERAEAVRGFRPSALRVQRDGATRAERDMVARLKAEVPRAVPEPWLVLEDKGAAVTFHFRAAPDMEAARARVGAAVDAVDVAGLLQRWGSRRALELRPRGAPNKGDALARLIDERQPDVVVMLGDDANDALAFDALRRARAAGRLDGLAIAVAGHVDIGPDAAARADLVLETPHEVARFLVLLAGAVAEATGRAVPGPSRRPRSSRGRRP